MSVGGVGGIWIRLQNDAENCSKVLNDIICQLNAEIFNFNLMRPQKIVPKR